MKILHLALAAVMSVSTLSAHENENAEKYEAEHSVRDVAEDIASTIGTEESTFAFGKFSGQLRAMYADWDQKATASTDTYSTAIGGYLNYESNSFKGLNIGAELAISRDLDFASGDSAKGKNNADLSSTDGKYTELSQAYLSYSYEKFNVKAGRILIDTPLADSDDIRMIHNTFSGAVATYEYEGIAFMAGHLSKWQGVDAGLDAPWVKTGDSGTNFGGISYADNLEFNLWYYNITKLTNAFYGDIGYVYHLNDTTDLHGGVQYLKESELSSSGTEADIYGAFGEVLIGDASFALAYNYADKNRAKASFSGFGGGTLYTNMDTMILDNITSDRSASAVVASAGYVINDVSLLYAYGDFDGDADSTNAKAHIVEQDFIVEYPYKDFIFSLTYTISQDKESTAKTADDWDRTQFLVAYNF